MIDMCRDFILDRLHYIDRIFGNENYLKEIEEEILDVAAAKTRMKRFVKIKMVVFYKINKFRIGSYRDLKLLRERVSLRSHMGGAVELKSSLDVVLGKFSKCLTLAREILATLRTQILPW